MSTTKKFDQFAERKLEELKAKSFEELLGYDGYSFSWSNKGRKADIGVAIENIDENEIRVILQGFLPMKFLSFIKHSFVDGFRKKKDGNVEPVTHEEISYYD
ncbi:MAG: hypothetical protein SVR94_18335 [Pseudomonadota bacterium]|nr:hypothetical protein [Pseudomonadota bacterium]